MTLVNCIVVSANQNKVIYPWKITHATDDNISIREFFLRNIRPSLDTGALVKAYLGKSKDSLDLIDLDIDLKSSVNAFGPFIKFVVDDGGQVPSTVRASGCAFQVLMSAQHVQSLPKRIEKDKMTKRDDLYNDVLEFLEKEDVAWYRSEVDGAGKRFVSALVDTLWYIDGHHDVFEKQSCKIPGIFTSFAGYNMPHTSKHRKRSVANMSGSTISSHASTMFGCLQGLYWKRPKFAKLKAATEELAKCLSQYGDYLQLQNKRMKQAHASPTPIRQLSDSLSVDIITKSSLRFQCYSAVCNTLRNMDDYEHMCLTDFCPEEPRHRYQFLQNLHRGLDISVVLLTYSPGNNCGNLHFIWKYDDSEPVEAVFQKSLPVVEVVKPLLPQYHTRAMRKSLLSKYGHVSSSVKPAVLRAFYKDLTGDSSAASNVDEAEIDKRVQLILDMEPEDPNTVIDLRSLNSSTDRAKFDVFWDHCAQVLEESVGTAVDDRRHGDVVHLAQAISVRDFRDQVVQRCPEGTPVPSHEWLRLQFWPKSKQSKRSTHYTGRLNVKFMIQRRQWRKHHDDAHYAAAIYRYEREFAVKFRELTNFVCIDDKHKIKVGEPHCPLAAAERGRRVLVHSGATFEVSDHDFSKFSMVPSVTLLVDIPSDISGSWYHGQVHVTLKEGAFEPSSPIRHSAELANFITSHSVVDKPILCLYSDGGPDHRLTYLSVKVALISLYLFHDLDYLIAARTAPQHSWRNPVERVMSTLNLGLQCVGLARHAGDEHFESEAKDCNTMKDLRKKAEKRPQFREEALDSVAPVKAILTGIFKRLKLKEKTIHVSAAATEDELAVIWESVASIDSNCSEYNCLRRKSDLKQSPKIKEFLSHCTRERHYFFEIKKCGQETCTICKPLRLTKEVFEQIKPFPDPVPGEEGHYLPFKDVYGSQTSEEHRPSLKKRSSKQRTLPFHGKLQHVKNADIMVECEECGMWRLVYATKKLTKQQQRTLMSALDGMSFSCGSPLQDLEVDDELKDAVFVKSLNCCEPVEILYYTAKYEPICIYCGQLEPFSNDKCYPQCEDCKDRPAISKK